MSASVEEPKKIVVGVDGSEASIAALLWAAAQAKLARAPLEVLSAWSWPNVWGREPTFPPGWDPAEQTRQQLSEVVESVLGAHPKVDVHLTVVEGHAASSLVTAAQEAALLVMGRRGRGIFAGISIGSVSTYCVAHAPCPVVVVHHRAEKIG